MNFGKWVYDRSAFTLWHEREAYDILLDEITNSGQMLDWIFQVHAKSWATKKDVWHLLQAFDHIFRPQETLCSFGELGKIDPREVAGVPAK